MSENVFASLEPRSDDGRKLPDIAQPGLVGGVVTGFFVCGLADGDGLGGGLGTSDGVGLDDCGGGWDGPTGVFG